MMTVHSPADMLGALHDHLDRLATQPGVLAAHLALHGWNITTPTAGDPALLVAMHEVSHLPALRAAAGDPGGLGDLPGSDSQRLVAARGLRVPGEAR